MAQVRTELLQRRHGCRQRRSRRGQPPQQPQDHQREDRHADGLVAHQDHEALQADGHARDAEAQHELGDHQRHHRPVQELRDGAVTLGGVAPGNKRAHFRVRHGVRLSRSVRTDVQLLSGMILQRLEPARGRDTMIRTFIPRSSALLLLGAISLLSACQTAPTTGAVAPATAPLPALPVPGAVHYVVDADHSDLRFLVYRAGPLASFGHNHVIQAKQMSGDVYLASDLRSSGFTLTLPVSGFDVDAPEARAVEGPDFAKQPAAADIDGTRKNMLGPGLLDAEHYPE